MHDIAQVCFWRRRGRRREPWCPSPNILKSTHCTEADVSAQHIALLLAPDTRDDVQHRPDRRGALLTATAVGTLVFGIIEGNEKGFDEPLVIAAFALCLLALARNAWVGSRHEAPLLDPRLFGVRGFRAGAIAVLVQFMAVFGFFFVGLQYLQLVPGYSPFKAAVALAPVGLLQLGASDGANPTTALSGGSIVVHKG